MRTQNILQVISREAEKIQESQVSLDKQKDQLATKLAQYESSISEELSLLKNIRTRLTPADVSSPTVTQPSNVNRNVTVAREAPRSILARIAFILIDANKQLSTDEIVAALKDRGQTPDAKDVRFYVGQRLAAFSADREKATKNDVLLRVGKRSGIYEINPKAIVSLGRNRKVSVEDLRSGVVPAPVVASNSNGGASEEVKPRNKTDVKAKVLKALKEMRKPASFTAMAAAAKVEAKSFQGVGMAFFKAGLLKKTRKTDDEGRKLYEIVHPKVNAAIKGAA